MSLCTLFLSNIVEKRNLIVQLICNISSGEYFQDLLLGNKTSELKEYPKIVLYKCFVFIYLFTILSYLILSYLILSYLILSYLILSYLILSYLILSYLI